MKVYSYDPVKGRKIKQIDDLPMISYTAESIDFMVSQGRMLPVDCNTKKPRKAMRGRDGESWTAHIDAGCGDHSYLRDEWICFCMGPMTSDREAYTWEWIILPPRELVR